MGLLEIVFPEYNLLFHFIPEYKCSQFDCKALNIPKVLHLYLRALESLHVHIRHGRLHGSDSMVLMGNSCQEMS